MSGRAKFSTRSILLRAEQQRGLAIALLNNVPLDPDKPLECLVREAPKDAKTREQEERYHAMLGDIAKQCRHLNLALDLDTWKRLAIDQFKRETLKEPECCAKYWARHQLNVMPSLDGSAIVVMGEQSRRFPKAVATVFVEWLFAFGAEREVAWSDPSVVPLEAYAA